MEEAAGPCLPEFALWQVSHPPALSTCWLLCMLQQGSASAQERQQRLLVEVEDRWGHQGSA